MNRRRLYFIIGSLLLPLGCLGNDGPTDPAARLEPSEFCSDHSGAAIATFEDAKLEAAIRRALSVGAQEPLTCGLISGLIMLDATSDRITSLVGIQNLTSLTQLFLGSNAITDINALSGLTSLMGLSFRANSITDISALSGLTSLTFLDLNGNRNLTDIQPLLDNTGLGAGDLVLLEFTNVSCTDLAALRAKGVTVISDCP